MVELLEVRSLRERVAPISVTHYEAMGERPNGKRTELIRGLVIEKMTISPLHSFLVARLHRLIQAALSEDVQCRQEQPLRLTDSMPEPDLAVVAGQESDYRLAHPTHAVFALEVAVTSSELDREKATIYAEAGIPEYWIVLANQEMIKVYVEPVNGLYTQQRNCRRGETVECGVLPALRVEVEGLFGERGDQE